MSRISTVISPPKQILMGPRLAESAFYLATGAALLAWAIAIVVDLVPKIFSRLNLETAILKHSGSLMLLLALTLISAIAFFGSFKALRSQSLPAPSGSILLITVAALRSLEIVTNHSVTITDANLLAGIFLGAAVLYYGPTRLWWLLLMPLASAAAFSPLVDLEFFKGADTPVLLQALVGPSCALLSATILIVVRELRARAIENVTSLQVLRLRSENTRTALRAMEADLKTLNEFFGGTTTAALNGVRAVASSFALAATGKSESVDAAASNADAAALDSEQGLVQKPVLVCDSAQADAGGDATTIAESVVEIPLEVALHTTEFNAGGGQVEASETCSFEEIELSARRLLEEARNAVAGRPVKLSLTAPSQSAGHPVAVRGGAASITVWMKSAILNSIESLGGFPDGAVRITLRPGVSALTISIEDNGRGFSESLLTKMGNHASDGRVSVSEIRAGVERIGGRFDIQARLGVGSRLSFELPRVDAFANSPRVAPVLRNKNLPATANAVSPASSSTILH